MANKQIQILMKELLANIDDQIAIIESQAQSAGIDPKLMRYQDGKWVLVDLYVAKANILMSLDKMDENW